MNDMRKGAYTPTCTISSELRRDVGADAQPGSRVGEAECECYRATK
jgi:hypothetical protein